jgi:uncharacterized protein YjbK
MDKEEIELKLLLDARAYQALQKRYSGDRSPESHEKLQVNHYYDTPELFFHQRGCTLRWRNEDGKGYLTVKIRKTIDESGISHALEWESLPGQFDLKPRDLEGLRGLILSWKHFPLEWKGALGEIRILGSMENHRLPLVGPDGLVLELDRTHYPSGSWGYELEVEGIDSPKVQRLLTEFQRFGISYQRAQEGKRSRFLRDLGLL